MRELSLALPSVASRRIGVHVGAGAAERLIDHAAVRHAGRLIVIVSDSIVGPLHGAPLETALTARGLRTAMLLFPAGERSKVRETKAALEDALAALGAGRDTLLVALGGGVTGDLAGFVAATWHRGVPLVHAPTSLLAMVDSALGGKTAVDLPAGKNLVGAFHQPEAIFADLAWLATLPDRELSCGCAEAVKTAVVADGALFRRIESGAELLLRRDAEALGHVVERCLSAKARIVARDECDEGRRAVLNFGHTAAHALEAASEYAIAHGEAVAIGMIVEAHAARQLQGFPAHALQRLRRVLSSLRLPTTWPANIAPARALQAARADKKSRAGRLRCALPVRIGTMARGNDPTTEIDDDLFGEAVRVAMEPAGPG